MTNLKRWLDDGAPDGVRELLVAASEEQPKAAGAQRTLVALGVGGAVVTGAVHASGVAGGTAGAAAVAKGATFASPLAIAMKWGFIGAVGAVTTLGAVHVVFQPPASEARPSSPAVPNRAPLRSSGVGEHLPRAAAPEAPAPAAAEISSALAAPPAPPPVTTRLAGSAPGPASIAPPRDDSVRMLEEVSGIDRARSALARGDAPGTIAAIDSYESKFSPRSFEPEALYLRMEALGRLGDIAGARALARRLVTAFPNAPQSARAKVVLSGATR
jgi:hypothetical protein